MVILDLAVNCRLGPRTSGFGQKQILALGSETAAWSPMADVHLLHRKSLESAETRPRRRFLRSSCSTIERLDLAVIRILRISTARKS